MSYDRARRGQERKRKTPFSINYQGLYELLIEAYEDVHSLSKKYVQKHPDAPDAPAVTAFVDKFSSPFINTVSQLRNVGQWGAPPSETSPFVRACIEFISQAGAIARTSADSWDWSANIELLTTIQRMLSTLNQATGATLMEPAYVEALQSELLGAVSIATAQLFNETRKLVLSARDGVAEAKEAMTESGLAALSHDFRDAADMEWGRATFWRRATFGLLFLVIGVASTVALGQVSWQAVGLRASLAIPLLAGAYYASAEARDHRSAARRERGWQLRLNTLQSYTISLPEEMRNEIRLNFAKALFSSPEVPEEGATLGDAQRELVNGLIRLVEAVRKT